MIWPVNLSEKSKTLWNLFAADIGNGQHCYRIYLNRACQFVKNSVDAQDVVQDFYLKAIRKADTYNFPITSLHDKKLGGWLNRVFINLMIDRVKLSGREIQYDKSIERVFSSKSEDNPIEATIRDENVEIVRREVDKMKLEYSDAIKLRYFRGMSLKEISSLTGKSETTIRGRIDSARRKLKGNRTLAKLLV